MPLLTSYVLAILRNENNELLLQYRTPQREYGGLYGLPGGKVESGELAIDALIRELKEELGITVTPSDITCAHTRRFLGKSGPGIAFFYTVHTWQGTIENKEPHKAEHIHWFSLNDLPSNMNPIHKTGLELWQRSVLYSEDGL